LTPAAVFPLVEKRNEKPDDEVDPPDVLGTGCARGNTNGEGEEGCADLEEGVVLAGAGVVEEGMFSPATR